MSAEIKTGRIFIQTRTSAGLKKKFQKHCAKLNVSEAQRLRDIIQKDIADGHLGKTATASNAEVPTSKG